MSYLCLPVDRPVTYLDIFHSFPYAVSVIVSSSSVSDAAAAKFVEYNILVATKTMSSELTWWSLRKRCVLAFWRGRCSRHLLTTPPPAALFPCVDSLNLKR